MIGIKTFLILFLIHCFEVAHGIEPDECTWQTLNLEKTRLSALPVPRGAISPEVIIARYVAPVRTLSQQKILQEFRQRRQNGRFRRPPLEDLLDRHLKAVGPSTDRFADSRKSRGIDLIELLPHELKINATRESTSS